MPENALQGRAPLGLLGGFDTAADGAFRGTLDLKMGSRLFVDAARVWSLRHRLPQTGTVERLGAPVEAGCLPREVTRGPGES